MNLKGILADAWPLVETIAPSIAGVIGGPMGLASGLALSILSAAFGTHPKDFKTLATTILTDPDVKAKLMAAEADHGGWLKGFVEDIKTPSHVEVNIKMDWDNQAS